VTLQIDEGPEVFDAKNSTLHPLFQSAAAGPPQA
jgi:5-carboxymethyl-2-hydroxymuconate isomerase